MVIATQLWETVHLGGSTLTLNYTSAGGVPDAGQFMGDSLLTSLGRRKEGGGGGGGGGKKEKKKEGKEEQ